jgi:hypothetical protein
MSRTKHHRMQEGQHLGAESCRKLAAMEARCAANKIFQVLGEAK